VRNQLIERERERVRVREISGPLKKSLFILLERKKVVLGS
jgi:hypothetical protein